MADQCPRKECGCRECELYWKIAELETRIERLLEERSAILNVKSKEGWLASEWVLRTSLAEKLQVELLIENNNLRLLCYDINNWYKSLNTKTLPTDVSYRLAREVERFIKDNFNSC